jgi:hypothetical protein
MRLSMFVFSPFILQEGIQKLKQSGYSNSLTFYKPSLSLFGINITRILASYTVLPVPFRELRRTLIHTNNMSKTNI